MAKQVDGISFLWQFFGCRFFKSFRMKWLFDDDAGFRAGKCGQRLDAGPSAGAAHALDRLPGLRSGRRAGLLRRGAEKNAAING